MRSKTPAGESKSSMMSDPLAGRSNKGTGSNKRPAAASSSRRTWLWIASSSFAARIIIALCSWGTSDTLGFLRFGFAIGRDGLLATYRNDPELNHPPIPAYWAWLAVEMGMHSAFAAGLLLRMPAILADAGSAYLLWKIASENGASETIALKAAALFCWSPAALLISAYHGNTDSVYAFLCLFAAYSLQMHPRPGRAGLALAAGINVKLIPVLIMPPLGADLFRKSRADRATSLSRFLLGAAAGILPFIPLLLLGGPSFRHNVLAYRSRIDLWGINFFLSLVAAPDSTGSLPLPALIAGYRACGRWIIIALVIGWTVTVTRRQDRWNAYDRAAVALSIFLIFAPGFGVQYLVAVLPLLFAARPVFAVAYGIASGVFLSAAYFVFWDGTFPVSSLFDRLLPLPVAALGLVPWGMLIYYVAITLARGSSNGGRRHLDNDQAINPSTTRP